MAGGVADGAAAVEGCLGAPVAGVVVGAQLLRLLPGAVEVIAEGLQVTGAYDTLFGGVEVGNVDERADFSEMVHAKLNDRHIGLVP